MTTTNELIRPVPLRVFLEAGCDPRDVLGNLEQLVEEMQTALDTAESARERVGVGEARPRSTLNSKAATSVTEIHDSRRKRL